MSDLSTLFQYAPMNAGFMTGINQRQGEDMAALRQKELAQLMQHRGTEEQRTSELHPFKMQEAELLNAGKRLTNRQAQQGIDYTDATQPEKILTDVQTNRLKRQHAVIQNLSTYADEIGSSPVPHAALAAKLKTMGMSEADTKSFMENFGKVPPAQLAAKMKEMNEKFLRNNPEYVRQMDDRRLQEEGDTARTRMNNNTSVQVANIHAAASAARGGSGKQLPPGFENDPGAILSWIRSEIKGKNPQTQLSALNRWIVTTEDKFPELAAILRREAEALSSTIQSLPQSNVRPGGIDPGAITGLPTIPPARPFVPGSGSQPQPTRKLGALPPGSKQIGTSGGKPVFQTPDGQKFIGE